MEAQVEKLEGNRIKVTATVPAADVDAAIKKAYREAAAKYTIPGFRKGKAPRPVIDTALGAEYILAQVTDEVINGAYPKIIDSENIYPTGSPKWNDDMKLVEDGKDFVFDFELDIKPEFELSSYEPCTVGVPPEGASEEEIDDQLRQLCESYFTYGDAEEGAAVADGNRVVLNQTAKLDSGRVLDTISAEEFTYSIGSGLLPESYDNELIGLKIGDRKSFEVEIPKDPTAYLTSASGVSKKVQVEAEVKSIKVKVVPEADDEFASEMMGFDTLAELRERIADSITSEKENMVPRMKEAQCMTQIANRLEGEVPASMAEDKESELYQSFFRQLQNQGNTFDAYLKNQGMTNEEFKKDIKEQAMMACKEDLALDAWARHFELTATEEDLDQEFINAGIEDPMAVKEEWREQGRLYLVRDGITRTKAAENVVDTAVIQVIGEDADEASAEEPAVEETAAE